MGKVFRDAVTSHSLNSVAKKNVCEIKETKISQFGLGNHQPLEPQRRDNHLSITNETDHKTYNYKLKIHIKTDILNKIILIYS